MKTSAQLQQQAFIRKLIYFGLIVVLFTVMTFSGGIAQALNGNKPVPALSVSAQAERLQLSESELGQANVLGSTARVVLTGSRGFAMCVLWLGAIEKQKRHEWNDLEMLVNVITKLQPHFLTAWLFQSWNLSYNVSVESDRVRDKYFYIAKGIDLLAQGERINRARGVDADGNPYVVGHPDMRYWIGFYYQNKFGASDEQNYLRSLFQLSCINPSQRDARLFRGQNKRVTENSPEFREFRKFVNAHPMLCRRLRDFLRCSTPDHVVDFLQDNWNLPTRYEIVDGVWGLKAKTEEQFPVLPDQYEPTVELANPRQELGDEFDNFYATWAWMTFAQEPLPPVEPGVPSAGVPDYDKLRYRMNRSPMSIIFRQAPPRSLSYMAERLQKEGWFDDAGWEVDEGLLTNLWFPSANSTEKVVGASPRYSAKAIWEKAYNAWDAHGREHGLSLDQTEIDNLEAVAKPFRIAYQIGSGQPVWNMKPEQLPPEMRAGLKAHQELIALGQNLHVSNFEHFKYEALAEKDSRIVEARKLMFAANRLRRAGNPEEAIRKFREAFEGRDASQGRDAFQGLCGNPAQGRRGLLEEYPNFRSDANTQELLYEKHLVFLRLLEERQGLAMRGQFSITQLSGFAARGGLDGVAGSYAGLLYQLTARPRELPSLFLAPMDGKDSQDRPWIPEWTAEGIKVREGYIKPRQPSPPVAPPNRTSARELP
jgi:hypothetical protein